MTKRLWFAAGVGIFAMLIDLAFHTFLTSPEETFLYFTMKFLLAAAVAFAFYRWGALKGALVGAAIFDILTGVYYGLAYYAGNPALSCCFLQPPQVFGLPYAAWLSFGYLTVSTWLLAFVVVHYFAFFAAYLLAKVVADR
ncbi:MAG: hypothetical protein KGI38_11940 [Thaumarchaeota archaeon]|nr:hypothetical protein [Nitrososphaerota archaeon]